MGAQNGDVIKVLAARDGSLPGNSVKISQGDES